MTESQGLFDDKSIFTNKEGRVNLLQTGFLTILWIFCLIYKKMKSQNKNFIKLEECFFRGFYHTIRPISHWRKAWFSRSFAESFLKEFHNKDESTPQNDHQDIFIYERNIKSWTKYQNYHIRGMSDSRMSTAIFISLMIWIRNFGARTLREN